MIYLLDTNVVSELVRPRPDPRVRAWLASQDEVALSVISIEELVFGNIPDFEDCGVLLFNPFSS